MVFMENVRDDTLAVSTAAVLVSPARYRNELVITNTSTAAQNITLSFGKPAVSGAGIFLTPYSVYYSPPTGVYSGEIFAIGDAINGQISIFER